MANGRPKAEVKRTGVALRRLVDLVSHRSGSALRAMNDAGVTLPQVLLVSRVERAGAATLAALAEQSPASAPALSQMVERLVQLNLIEREEDPGDRRCKVVRATTRACTLMRKLEAARSTDYEAGLAPLSQTTRAELARALERAALEIEEALR